MPTSRSHRDNQAGLASRFFEQGYLFPIDVLTRADAAHYRRELEALEGRVGDSKVGNKAQLNHPHVIFRFADEMVRAPRILDVVEQLIGPDILVWSTTFFIKEPRSESYVSWHQDLRYWGLDDENGQVSAWIALGPVSPDNGCMRFLPGSHKGPIVAHNDTRAADNFLTRGQEAAIEIDEENTVQVPLAPGQASFHHGKLLHASAPNRSDQRRIGLVINYIAPHVRQVVANEDFAMLVRGQDRYGHFRHSPPPGADLSDEALAWHGRILTAQNEAIYDEAAAKQRGPLVDADNIDPEGSLSSRTSTVEARSPSGTPRGA